MAGDLSIEVEEPVERVSIEPAGQTALPSLTVADHRAAKANYGLGQLSPGYDKLKEDIAGGFEDQQRVTAAQKITESKKSTKGAQLAELAMQPVGKDTKAKADAILGYDPVEAPDSVFEKYFAQRYAKDHADATEASVENPKQAQDTLDFGVESIAKQELIRKAKEDAQAYNAKIGGEGLQGLLGAGLDALRATYFPFIIPWSERTKNLANLTAVIPAYQLRNLVIPGSLLPGANLDDQIRGWWSLPLEQAQVKLKEVMEYLRGVNPLLAAEFAQNLENHDPMTGLALNIGVGFDISSIPAIRATKLAKNALFKKKMADVVRSNTYDNVSDKLTALGQTEAAVVDKAERLLTTQKVDLEGKPIFTVPDKPGGSSYDPAGVTLELREVVHSSIDPSSFHLQNNRGYLTKEAALRLEGQLTQAAQETETAIQKAQTVNRITGDQKAIAYKQNYEAFKERFTSVQDGIINFGFERAIGSNIDYGIAKIGTKSELVQVQGQPNAGPLGFWEPITTLGTKASEGFKGATAADTYAQKVYGLGHEQYTVFPEGDKWYIRIAGAVVEKTDEVRAAAISTRNADNHSWINAIFGWVRGAAETVSSFQREARVTAQFAPQAIQKIVRNQRAEFLNANLTRRERRELKEVFDYQHIQLDYAKDQPAGKYSSSPADLQADYLTVHKRMPTEVEQLAYFHTKQVNDIEYLYLNHNLHRDLSIRGGESFTIPMPDGVGRTAPFVGIPMKDMPWKLHPKENFGMVVLKDGEYGKTFFRLNKTAEELNVIEEELKGYQIIRMAVPEMRPLRDIFGDGPLHYVATKDLERRPLNAHQIQYNEGGHTMYQDRVKVVQPNFGYHPDIPGLHLYWGDTITTLHPNQVDGAEWAKAYNGLAELIRSNATRAVLDNYIAKNLPADKDWLKAFASGELSVEHPFVAIPFGPGETSLGNHPTLRSKYPKDKMWDLTQESNPTFGIDKTYMRAKEGPGMTPVNRGTALNPVYKLERAKELNPFAAMDRSFTNVFSRNRYMNDYRDMAVENWMQNWWQTFKPTATKEEMLRNPYYYFYNGEFSQLTTNNAADIANATQSRRNITAFLGQRSVPERQLDVALEGLGEVLFGKFGNNPFTRFGDRTLRSVTDWPTYVRSATSFANFTASLAMIPVQLISAINPILVSPLHGLQGLSFALIHSATNLNQGRIISKGIDAVFSEATLNKMYSGFSKMPGWKPGWFQEAQDLLRSSSYEKVGREITYRDNVGDMKLTPDAMDKVAAVGWATISKPEQFVKQTAFGVAYHEWKSAGGVLTAGNRNDIANALTLRASNLALNMTREGNSNLNRGLIGVPMAYSSYLQRLYEQFSPFNKLHPPQQKATAFIGYATLFGVPAITSSATSMSILPLGDLLRKYLIENWDQKTRENSAIQIPLNGLLTQMGVWATGKNYNFGDVLSPGNFPVFGAIAQSLLGVDRDTSMMEKLSGAPGSFVERAMKAAHPFLGGLYAAVRGDQETFPLTQDDWVQAARILKGVDQGFNLWLAWNYSRYETKSATLIADNLDKQDAIFQALGFTRRDITDMWLTSNAEARERAYKEKLKPYILEEFRRAWKAYGDLDDDKGTLFMRRAKTYAKSGNFTNKEVEDMFTSTARSQGPALARSQARWLAPRNNDDMKRINRLKRTLGIPVE